MVYIRTVSSFNRTGSYNSELKFTADILHPTMGEVTDHIIHTPHTLSRGLNTKKKGLVGRKKKRWQGSKSLLCYVDGYRTNFD